MRYPLDGPMKGGNFLGPGVHDVKIEDLRYETRNTQKGQRPVMVVVFADMNGATVRDTFWMSEEARWRVLKLASACGLCKTEEQKAGFDTEHLLGCRLRVSVREREHDGKMYGEVFDFSPATGRIMSMPSRSAAPEPEPPPADDDYFDDPPVGGENPF